MEIFFGTLIFSVILILYFVFIKPFLKGYNEGMTEKEKLDNAPILALRIGKSIGFKKIIFAALVVVGVFLIYSKNANDVNSNQHSVTQSDGSQFMRTNPNSTTADNIGANRSDTFWGIVLLLGSSVIFYRIFLRK